MSRPDRVRSGPSGPPRLSVHGTLFGAMARANAPVAGGQPLESQRQAMGRGGRALGLAARPHAPFSEDKLGATRPIAQLRSSSVESLRRSTQLMRRANRAGTGVDPISRAARCASVGGSVAGGSSGAEEGQVPTAWAHRFGSVATVAATTGGEPGCSATAQPITPSTTSHRTAALRYASRTSLGGTVGTGNGASANPLASSLTAGESVDSEEALAERLFADWRAAREAELGGGGGGSVSARPATAHHPDLAVKGVSAFSAKSCARAPGLSTAPPGLSTARSSGDESAQLVGTSCRTGGTSAKRRDIGARPASAAATTSEWRGDTHATAATSQWRVAVPGVSREGTYEQGAPSWGAHRPLLVDGGLGSAASSSCSDDEPGDKLADTAQLAPVSSGWMSTRSSVSTASDISGTPGSIAWARREEPGRAGGGQRYDARAYAGGGSCGSEETRRMGSDGSGRGDEDYVGWEAFRSRVSLGSERTRRASSEGTRRVGSEGSGRGDEDGGGEDAEGGFRAEDMEDVRWQSRQSRLGGLRASEDAEDARRSRGSCGSEGTRRAGSEGTHRADSESSRGSVDSLVPHTRQGVAAVGSAVGLGGGLRDGLGGGLRGGLGGGELDGGLGGGLGGGLSGGLGGGLGRGELDGGTWPQRLSSYHPDSILPQRGELDVGSHRRLRVSDRVSDRVTDRMSDRVMDRMSDLAGENDQRARTGNGRLGSDKLLLVTGRPGRVSDLVRRFLDAPPISAQERAALNLKEAAGGGSPKSAGAHARMLARAPGASAHASGWTAPPATELTAALSPLGRDGGGDARGNSRSHCPLRSPSPVRSSVSPVLLRRQGDNQSIHDGGSTALEHAGSAALEHAARQSIDAKLRELRKRYGLGESVDAAGGPFAQRTADNEQSAAQANGPPETQATQPLATTSQPTASALAPDGARPHDAAVSVQEQARTSAEKRRVEGVARAAAARATAAVTLQCATRARSARRGFDAARAACVRLQVATCGHEARNRAASLAAASMPTKPAALVDSAVLAVADAQRGRSDTSPVGVSELQRRAALLGVSSISLAAIVDDTEPGVTPTSGPTLDASPPDPSQLRSPHPATILGLSSAAPVGKTLAPRSPGSPHRRPPSSPPPLSPHAAATHGHAHAQQRAASGQEVAIWAKANDLIGQTVHSWFGRGVGGAGGGGAALEVLWESIFGPPARAGAVAKDAVATNAVTTNAGTNADASSSVPSADLHMDSHVPGLRTDLRTDLHTDLSAGASVAGHTGTGATGGRTPELFVFEFGEEEQSEDVIAEAEGGTGEVSTGEGNTGDSSQVRTISPLPDSLSDSLVPDSLVPDSLLDSLPDSHVPDSNVPDSHVPDSYVPDSPVAPSPCAASAKAEGASAESDECSPLGHEQTHRTSASDTGGSADADAGARGTVAAADTAGLGEGGGFFPAPYSAARSRTSSSFEARREEAEARSSSSARRKLDTDAKATDAALAPRLEPQLQAEPAARSERAGAGTLDAKPTNGGEGAPLEAAPSLSPPEVATSIGATPTPEWATRSGAAVLESDAVLAVLHERERLCEERLLELAVRRGVGLSD